MNFAFHIAKVPLGFHILVSSGKLYEIKEYTNMVIPYTLSWENYMSAFTTIVNNIYLFLIPVGILKGIKNTGTS
ncbi:hypothetical protein [Clostridium kluyveri]|uniref:hypothetical protein n=1 Tax=Clostridium kluyveri TaxID=1534 RepID=UPI0009F8DBB2|nr:hypothetical protein [Clostridium kluyveri]UZQ48509.1 hypothetical protein OP486_10820 [Clostridium kluyveri]